ncbi:hypothetical protein AYL99_07188 [Fonsecaea erecta]|uniref:Uncharacterized protein n=1 Tax=Fonsecaea erecta TaxID=1367422 RepID=A0A178ZEB7_9EURO|nr:hypothetical protein AYL99_07188 [Fonsecaea erecta]OAP58098.1 hypothetical protein AYL99_07188 [Fonsecaea erecta]
MRFAAVATAVALFVMGTGLLLVSALPTHINDAGIQPFAGEDSPFACHGVLEHTPARPAVLLGDAGGSSEEDAEATTPEPHDPAVEVTAGFGSTWPDHIDTIESTPAVDMELTPPDDMEAVPSPLVEAEGHGDGYVGQSVVYNNCNFAVHSNIVHGPRPGDEGPPEEIYSILQSQDSLKHPFAHDPRMGVSWKLWRTGVENTAPVQFEWTWHDSFQRTWYDLSMINAGEVGWLNEDAHQGEAIVGDEDGLGAYVGRVAIKHAFTDEGMTLTPGIVQGNCVPIRCAPGEEYCTASYNAHNDWGQQHDCGEAVDLKLTLCG